MNKIKIIVALTIITASLGSIGGQYVYAATIDNNTQIKVESIKEQKMDIQKLDKYVELNTNTRQFTLNDSAYLELSRNEVNFIQESINKSNELVKEYNSQLISDTYKKSFRQYERLNKSQRITRSIDTSAYWDWEVCWWGKRVYLHNNLIKDMQSYSNTVLGGAGFTGVVLTNCLAELGVASGPIGLIVGAFGLNAAYTYDRIVNNNSGNGVYLDTFWGTGLGTYWKVYGA